MGDFTVKVVARLPRPIMNGERAELLERSGGTVWISNDAQAVKTLWRFHGLLNVTVAHARAIRETLEVLRHVDPRPRIVAVEVWATDVPRELY
jgi:hypothetical protein